MDMKEQKANEGRPIDVFFRIATALLFALASLLAISVAVRAETVSTWRVGDVAPVDVICLSEAGAKAVAAAATDSKQAASQAFTEQVEAGICGIINGRLPLTLTRKVLSFTDFDADDMEIWEGDVGGMVLFVWLIANRGPHTTNEAS